MAKKKKLYLNILEMEFVDWKLYVFSNARSSIFINQISILHLKCLVFYICIFINQISILHVNLMIKI
jgi:hypothetical protein